MHVTFGDNPAGIPCKNSDWFSSCIIQIVQYCTNTNDDNQFKNSDECQTLLLAGGGVRLDKITTKRAFFNSLCDNSIGIHCKNYDRCSSCASFLSNTDETQSQASQFNFWGQIISKRLPTMIFKFWNIKPISICLSAFLNLSNLCFFARCVGGTSKFATNTQKFSSTSLNDDYVGLPFTSTLRFCHKMKIFQSLN